MTKPRNLHWNDIAQRWEASGRDGIVSAYIDGNGLGGDNVAVGTALTAAGLTMGGGTKLTYMLSFTGTSAAITSVGSGAIAVGTITNATGIAVGDKVFGNARGSTSDSHVAFAGFRIPTANVLNVLLSNSKPDSAGSYVAVGWDIVAIRAA